MDGRAAIPAIELPSQRCAFGSPGHSNKDRSRIGWRYAHAALSVCNDTGYTGSRAGGGGVIGRFGNPNSVPCTMKPKLALSLIAYAIVTVAGGLLAYRMNPELASTTLVATTAGGVLCCLWGVLSLLVNRGRGWAVLTLAATSFTLLTQAVVTWTGPVDFEAGARWVPLLITLMFGLSVVMLTWLAHSEPVPARKTETLA